MSGHNVAALAADLARAVELTLSPEASQSDRLKAYNACESFKETSPLCAEAGLFLAAGTQNSLISRHFGLQLMEYTVKYRWTQISQQEKLFIKENAMKLLAAGGISEEPHMKDALSRVIVEMVKREWPQQWPDLLNELSNACQCGEIQTELVLLVFLRLVEDVALLQTLESNQRRKDIYHALTANMATIFEFFLRLIELHVGQFRQCSGDPQNTSKAAAHGRVVQVVLLTLTGFVEWVSMVHVMAQNGRLLHILCLLLNDVAFQYPAAECLSQVVNRKGKMDERKPLLILFNTEPMQCLVTAAKTIEIVDNEQNYLFKKKLIQVFGGLATQVCTLWSKDGLSRPQNFSMFLEGILAYSSHHSLSLAHLGNPIWNSMLKNEHVARDPVFLSYIPQWVQCTAPKIVKFNYPNNHGSSSDSAQAYAKIEFDSEEEFALYFYRCRSDFLDSFRQATVVAPLVTFNYVEQWLIKCLQVPNTTTGGINDPVHQEWEALSTLLESILSRVLQAQERPSIASGLQLLQLCLNYQPADPLILSTLLTCISALFVFLSMSTGQMAPQVNSVAASGAVLLPQVLEKIFSTLIFSPENKDSRSRAVKNVRRHAASLMVKIGNKYPLLLLPVFDQIRATVDSLSQAQGPGGLTTLEKVTLKEALLLISNHFCDYDRQSNFVGEVLREASTLFMSIVNQGAFKGAREFIAFVGLTKDAQDDSCGQNRSNIVFCVNLILGAIKRCSWPDDPERATRGGFVVSLTESGNPVFRNPAAPHVVPLLPHLLSLIKIFNETFTPDAQSTIHDSYKGCLSMPEAEKSNLLGLIGHASADTNDSQSSLNPVERMQRFLTSLHESCYHMMGSLGPSLGRDLYAIPDIGLAIVNSILSHLDYIPDYRLRPIIRVFLKAFVYSCPAPYYEVDLLPILTHITPIMLSKLHLKWQLVIEFRNREAQEDNTDTQEVLEDILTRALTREYLDFLKVALVGGSLTPESNSETMETEELSMDSPTPPPTRANMAAEVISDLGLIILRYEKTCQSTVLAVLDALSWIDSNASLKATLLTGPMVRQLVSDNSLNGPMAAHIMRAVLNALMLHGQHEANQGSLLTLGAQVYELLRPSFLEVLAVMQLIPGVNPVDLHKLDERISGSTSKGNKVEKVKKDLFKKLTGNLIGRSVGQLFKKEVKIQDLPRLAVPQKPSLNRPEVISDLRNIFS
ncbi:unnamed protein product [Brassicogethes aeneus]|uniref:Importin N-terminal domain-containing protein n=1 Tax=Brassicogethes aeneus TaxID=1431903 RepID=A0A9P0B9J2_BRAAE|nr:unnamed protein product [Brassicogethes aeneus]